MNRMRFGSLGHVQQLYLRYVKLKSALLSRSARMLFCGTMAACRWPVSKGFVINASCEAKRFHSMRERHSRLQMVYSRYYHQCL
jgi:hypothetical protein